MERLSGRIIPIFQLEFRKSILLDKDTKHTHLFPALKDLHYLLLPVVLQTETTTTLGKF